MKANVYDNTGKQAGEVELPSVFSTPLREDVIRRAVLAEESREKQPKGAYRWAGLETSARYIGRKEAYATLKNRGQSRLPREFFGGGIPGRVRYIPSSVGGRRAHPPKPEKKIEEKINKKEWDLALRSAIAATSLLEVVQARGHKVSSAPVVLDGAEGISKAKEVFALFKALFPEEVERASKKRGRNKKYPKSALVVVSDANVPLAKAAKNLPGVDVAAVSSLKVKDFAPGTHPGRFAVYTKEALKELEKRWNE